MRKRLFSMLAALALSLAATPVLADEEKSRPFTALFTYPPALGSLLVSLLAAYLLSVAITALFRPPAFYPPNVAKLACWFSFSAWLLCVALFILRLILRITLTPIGWALMALLLIVLLVLALNSRSAIKA